MPSLSLDRIEGVVDTLQSRHLAILPERCSRQRHRQSTCTRCLDACPTGALTWDDDGLEVDPELCVQCGICSTACPTGAIEARSPGHDELWVQAQRSAQERGWAGFVCSRAAVPAPARQGLIQVSCLGRIDESLLVGAAAYGARTLWLVAGECAGCPLALGRQLLDGVIARAEALLQAFGRSASIVVGSDLPAELSAGKQEGGSGVSRRGLFKTLVRETARLGEAAQVPPGAGQEQPEVRVYADGLPSALPEKRLMLVAALEHMGRPADTRFQAGEGGLWAGLKFGSDCTACQMCAYFCPTGALLKAEHEGRVAVVYQVSRCVNCGLCSDICYRHAVLPLGEVDLGRVMDGSVELLCVRQASSAPWQESNQEKTARAILDLLA